MRQTLTLAALVAFIVTPVFAHVTLETASATVGGSYKAVFRVPHGCSGAATTAIRVQIPEGFIVAKPMPKPGWSIAVQTGTYGGKYTLYGTTVTSGAVEIDWTGGSLPDAWYDEFVLVGQVAGNLGVGSRLYFPVVQECGTDAERWIMIPKDSQSAGDLERPAPSVRLTPAAGDADGDGD